MTMASSSSGRQLSIESMSGHGADGDDSALTSEEWTDAQVILTSAHGEFGKYEKQISGLLSEVGCGNKEDHMFVKLILVLVIKIHVDLPLLSAAIPVSFCVFCSAVQSSLISGRSSSRPSTPCAPRSTPSILSRTYFFTAGFMLRQLDQVIVYNLM